MDAALVATELSTSPALPRLDETGVRLLNRLYAHGASVSLVPMEMAATLGFEWPDESPRTLAPPCEAFRFRLGGAGGEVALDRLLVSRLLREPAAERLPAVLRQVLLAEALQPLADAVERATNLRFEWEAPVGPENSRAAAAPRPAPHAAHFRLEAAAQTLPQPPLAGGRGYLQLDDAAAFERLMAAWPCRAAAPRRPLQWLRLPLRFSLGSTRLTLAEMKGIQRGDIVSIEQWGASDNALRVRANAGGRSFVGLAEGPRIKIQQVRDSEMTRDPATEAEGSLRMQADGLPPDRLDALEVTLYFEVGDLTVPLGELRNVRAGHVFDLGQHLNRSVVRIVAHGNVLGKGHLVAVGDRLGVRIAEFAPGDA